MPRRIRMIIVAAAVDYLQLILKAKSFRDRKNSLNEALRID